MTAWTDFIGKIYKEEHDKDPSYQYKQAMMDASKRKGEMGATAVKGSVASGVKGTRKSRRKGKRSRGTKTCECPKKCKCGKKGKRGGTRKNRKH